MGWAKYAEDNQEIVMNRQAEGRSLGSYTPPYFYQNTECVVIHNWRNENTTHLKKSSCQQKTKHSRKYS